ncbi:Uncharacterized protein FWK35_00016358, partial [Aphis craccivora]
GCHYIVKSYYPIIFLSNLNPPRLCNCTRLFLIRLAFAMTINKSQDQKMSVSDLKLCTSCFSHGQLFVACFRVSKPSSIN